MLLALSTPAEHDRGPRYMAQVLASLHAAIKEPISLEYGRHAHTAGLYCRVRPSLAKVVERQLTGAYPDVEIERLDDAAIDPPPAIAIHTRELWLARDVLAIEMCEAFEDRLSRELTDPLAGILGLLAAGPRMTLWSHVAIELSPASPHRARVARRILNRYYKTPLHDQHRRGRRFLAAATSPNLLRRMIARVVAWTFYARRTALPSIESKSAYAKLDQPLYTARIRLTAAADTAAATERQLRQLAAAFAPYSVNSHAEFCVVRDGGNRRGSLLSVDELAILFHPTTADFRGDVRRELLDFIDVVTADSMLRAGKQGRGAVEAWVSAMRTEAGFRGALLRYLAYGVLLQDHRRGLVEAEQVCFKAGDDDRRQLDALYLRGRARWYGKKDERAAIDDLRIARDLARRFHRPEREAWACYYLARLGIEQPQLLPNQTPECLIDEVERIARSIGRPDLELLATRARMTYLMQRRRYDEAIRLGREILDHSQGWDREGVDRILGYLRTDLGVCLRALNEETARVEAERYYDQGIKSGRIGSYAGMCLYLKSDLYSDRMVDALHSAAEARGNEDERSRWLAKAELHRQEALKLARQALEALKPTGDDAALHKASIRELLLENQPIASPLTRRGVLQDYATRHQQLTQTFLGTAAIDGSERYSPQPNEIPLNRLQGFLEEYFTGVAAYVGHAPHSERVNIDDFLRPDTLLAVPWIVGSSLVVRVFRRDDKRAVASNAGWFTLDRYQPTARMMFRQLLRIKEPGLFLDLSDETLITLQQRLRTVDAIAVSEPGELPRHIVVVGPNENVDWVCPIEWLRTSAGFGARRTSLLEITRGALMYATSRKGPLRSVNTPIPSEWTVIATDQQAGGMTVYQRARQAFGDRARQVQADSSASITNLSEGVMVLAHSGPNWSIENFLQRADWTGVRSVVLLFCSSSQYSVSAGPFIDGVTLRIREALGNDSLVVAARMPVDIEDAIQLGEELQLPLHRGAPLPEVITQHLRNAQHYGIHAYQKPWVVLG